MLDPAAIARIAVYPPIGIARLGNAAGDDAYFFATEVVGGTPEPAGGFRVEGRIKRQAVRFRLYATMTDGAVREVVAADVTTIEWRVHVANLKAGWYNFTQAMDLPDGLSKPATRRNALERRRDQLDITPSPIAIAGRNVAAPSYRFRDGQFYARTVELGEVRTDGEGRLIFLGGTGMSAPFRPGMRPLTFANNDFWHDDVSDGPVRASVTIGATRIEAEPGYVVVAPPNFAPGLFGVVTMDDTVRETFYEAGDLPRPATTNFTRDLWPIFDRLTGMGWVNHGLFVTHGHASPLDARDPAVIDRLRDPRPESRAFRRRVLALFRDPAAGGEVDWVKVPLVYGDAFGEEDRHPRALLSASPTMHAHLRRWADGQFVDDWRGIPVPPRFEDLNPTDQTAHLDRVALYECLGGPFHPGIELTWIMRRRSLWAAPYRLKLLPEGESVRQDYGAELTPATCLSGGPLQAAGPGALTRWMGVPWQTDEASCNSSADYAPSTYLSMPSFWGARVPDQVLSSNAWMRVQDARARERQRLKHFFHREDWLRDVRATDYYGRIQNMVTMWWQLGLVLPQVAPQETIEQGFPSVVHVETGRDADSAGTDDKVQLVTLVEQLNTDEPEPAAEAGAAPARPHVPPRRTFRQGEI
jgi:hypothetical protein